MHFGYSLCAELISNFNVGCRFFTIHSRKEDYWISRSEMKELVSQKSWFLFYFQFCSLERVTWCNMHRSSKGCDECHTHKLMAVFTIVKKNLSAILCAALFLRGNSLVSMEVVPNLAKGKDKVRWNPVFYV